MKKYVVWMVTLILFICAAVLIGCGKEDVEDLYVLWTDTEDLPVPSDMDGELLYLDMQYYQGEPVQFWGKLQDDETGIKVLQVFLYEPDGSSRVLLDAVSIEYYNYSWFLAQDGSFILFRGTELVRLGAEGHELYRQSTQNSLGEICQLPDGSIFLLTLRIDDASYQLEQMNPDTGTMKNMDKVSLGSIAEGSIHISAGEKGILLLDSEGFWEINVSTGKKTGVLTFAETKYVLSGNMSDPEDFCMTGASQVELLLQGSRVNLYVQNVGRERTVITVRLINVNNWLQECTTRFNRENETYYVMLEQPDENTSRSELETKTAVEIISGKVDIVDGLILSDEAGLIENGSLVDLAPWMEESGIRVEDFFPIAFDGWRNGEKIYGVTLHSSAMNYWISEELLKGATPDIETLVDGMLDYQGQKVFGYAMDETDILEFLLSGSEDLWGMIDWGEGTCDFSGELFRKMLEAAKKLKYDRQMNSGDPDYLTAFKMVRFYNNNVVAAYTNTEGKAAAGWLFDDGYYPVQTTSETYAIPSAAPHKEGAWEFLCYLLKEEQQLEIQNMTNNDSILPVNRKAYEAVAEKEIEEGSIVIIYTPKVRVMYKAGDWSDMTEEEYKALYDLTPERAENVREALERVRYVPYRTEYILDIIYEETAAYFAGDKSLEEICDILESRVGIYVKERQQK